MMVPASPSDAADRSTPHRFAALDSMRGIAACIVVLLHIDGAGYLTGSTFIARGYLFVDFFFVLSGFVIAASYGERLANGFALRTFLLLRLGRLYPLHLAMLLAFAALTWAMPGLDAFTYGSMEAGQLARAVFMLEAFAPADSGWNAPSWSIEVEFWAYVLCALTCAAMGRRAWLILPLVIAGSGLVWLLALGGMRWQPLGLEFSDLMRCLFAFGLGALAWEGYRRFGARLALSPARANVAEMGLILICIAMISVVPILPLRIAIPFVFAAVALVLAQERGVIARTLTRPAPVFVGTLSYSIYMTHTAALIIIALIAVQLGWLAPGTTDLLGARGTVPPGLTSDLIALASLLTVIAVSYLSYRWIEAPARRWSRRLAAKHDAARAEAIAPTF